MSVTPEIGSIIEWGEPRESAEVIGVNEGYPVVRMGGGPVTIRVPHQVISAPSAVFSAGQFVIHQGGGSEVYQIQRITPTGTIVFEERPGVYMDPSEYRPVPFKVEVGDKVRVRYKNRWLERRVKSVSSVGLGVSIVGRIVVCSWGNCVRPRAPGLVSVVFTNNIKYTYRNPRNLPVEVGDYVYVNTRLGAKSTVLGVGRVVKTSPIVSAAECEVLGIVDKTWVKLGNQNRVDEAQKAVDTARRALEKAEERLNNVK